MQPQNPQLFQFFHLDCATEQQQRDDQLQPSLPPQASDQPLHPTVIGGNSDSEGVTSQEEYATACESSGDHYLPAVFDTVKTAQLTNQPLVEESQMDIDECFDYV